MKLFEKQIDSSFATNGKTRLVLDRDFVNNKCIICVEFFKFNSNKNKCEPFDESKDGKWERSHSIEGDSWAEVLEKLSPKSLADKMK